MSAGTTPQAPRYLGLLPTLLDNSTGTVGTRQITARCILRRPGCPDSFPSAGHPPLIFAAILPTQPTLSLSKPSALRPQRKRGSAEPEIISLLFAGLSFRESWLRPRLVVSPFLRRTKA